MLEDVDDVGSAAWHTILDRDISDGLRVKLLKSFPKSV